MVKYALHSLLWTERFDLETEFFVRKAKSLGFDGIEVYVSPQQIGDFRLEKVRRVLEDLEMECVGSTSLTLETDITSSDEAVRERGVHYLKECAKLFSELGAKLVSGVIYTAWGKIVGRGRTEDEWTYAVKGLKKVCNAVKGYGVVLGVEPVNRFETYFLNTAADAIRLVKNVDENNIGVHLDTFHMNIEEKNFYEPIVMAGKMLCHFHCSENDRGVVGTGHVNWCEVFRGLAEVDYDGWITIESFTPELKNIATKTAIWRQLAPNADFLASESLKFLKSMEKRYFR
jgi:D-psicose/D-tagatose/L-ribulose 3-epimerase